MSRLDSPCAARPAISRSRGVSDCGGLSRSSAGVWAPSQVAASVAAVRAAARALEPRSAARYARLASAAASAASRLAPMFANPAATLSRAPASWVANAVAWAA
jgi:hypothetical protein